MELKRALDAGYRTYLPYTILAAAGAAKGNDAEAKLAVAEGAQLTVKWLLEQAPVLPVIVEGLRKAALQEE